MICLVSCNFFVLFSVGSTDFIMTWEVFLCSTYWKSLASKLILFLFEIFGKSLVSHLPWHFFVEGFYYFSFNSLINLEVFQIVYFFLIRFDTIGHFQEIFTFI